mgnify:CR=1 FL=1
MAHRQSPAARLRKVREGLNLSQSAMAALLGVTRVTLSCWERGRSLPSLEKAVLLEKRTGIPPSAWRTEGRAGA